VPEDNEWEQGALDANGVKQGPFTYWRADGSRCNVCTLEDGQPQGPFKRFHENGEVSQEGTWLDGVLHGTRRWRACDEATSEQMHEGGVDERVRVSEMDYAKGRVIAIRHFDADGNRVAPDGAPYPERPRGVVDGAEFVPDEGVWKLGSADGETGAREGRWRVWTATGAGIVDAQYVKGVLQGEVRQWVRDANPFLDEHVACEAGLCERGQRVGPWEFVDAHGAVLFEVDYGSVAPLGIPHLQAWSNETTVDWLALGQSLMQAGLVRSGLVTLARACAVAKSVEPLQPYLGAHTRPLKRDASLAFADQVDGELPALCTALVDGCALAQVLRKIAIALDQALQSRAALDFINAALLFDPRATEFLFTRALILMSLGLTSEAERDGGELASAAPDQAEFLLDYVRFLFPSFTFWPAGEKSDGKAEGPAAPVKSLAEVQHLVQVYATRLVALREAMLVRVTPDVPYLVPEVRALLPEGPVELPDEAALELHGVDLPSLVRLARGDWAALGWLLWSCGASAMTWPTTMTAPKTFSQAVGMAQHRLWRARDQRAFNGKNAREHGVEGFQWEGSDLAELHPTLAAIAEQQYAEVQAVFFWLSRADVRSPWQDELRGS
jgi:antitoxin component YwqK of YwqJK toxin-antitoxin module/tetratricopeptide (TPR) repeat protein